MNDKNGHLIQANRMRYHLLVQKFTDMSDAGRIALLMTFSVALKVVVIANVDLINPDGIRYLNSAHHLFLGNFSEAFAHEKMLPYSFTLGLFHLVIRDWQLAGQLLSSFFLVLTLIPLYLFTKDLFGSMSAFWAGVAFSLMPSVNELASEVVKDGPFLFFLTGGLWCVGKGVASQRMPGFFLAFCCAAMATLFRFEGIIFIATTLLYLVWQVLSHREDRPNFYKGLLAYSALPVVGLLAAVVLLFSGLVDVSVLEKVWMRFDTHYFQPGLTENYRRIYSYLREIEGNFPGGQWGQNFFEISRYNIFLIYLLGLMQSLVKTLFPLYLIPLYFGLKSKCWLQRESSLLFMMILAYLGMAYAFIMTRNFLSDRYLMAVVVMLMPIVGYGFEELRLYLSNMRLKKLFIAVALLLFVFVPMYKTYEQSCGDKDEIRICGDWLKKQTDNKILNMISSDERIPFYAGLLRDQYHVFPEGAEQSYEEIAMQRGSTLMVLRQSVKQSDTRPVFHHYRLIREFPGSTSVVLVYKRT